MARTVAQGFELFLDWLVPTTGEQDARARHRDRVERSLHGALDISRIREIGSFSHGTGVRGHCDADILVSLKYDRPGSSDTALGWVKETLEASFPHTVVRVSRPAVVVAFAGGKETWEVTPGFYKATTQAGNHVYYIPGAASGWLESAPQEHLNYVTGINTTEGITGGAKKLARLAKAWKYYNNVPISSFYLEMRAASYMADEKSFVPIYDVSRFLGWLDKIGLAAMNDPKGVAGRFFACSTTAKGEEALSKLATAATRAQKALDAHENGDPDTAFHYLDLLFGGEFPAR